VKRFLVFFLTLSLLLVPAVAFAENPSPIPICDTEGSFGSLCKLRPGEGGASGISLVFTILLILAVITALLFLIWGGIKWITSGGDKAALEGARNLIIAALVGLVLAFLSFFLVGLVYYFFTGESLGSLDLPKLID